MTRSACGIARTIKPRGFPISGTYTAVASIPIRNAIAANGAFVNYEYFPSLGYQSGAELASGERSPQGGTAPEDAAAAAGRRSRACVTYLGVNADWIGFKATVSTAADQIALAPGHLQREYTENGRRFFEYRDHEPMLTFFTFLSARYEVKRPSGTASAARGLSTTRATSSTSTA